jgi:hypothetical protein
VDLLDSPFFIWGVALFGLFKHIPLLPHCGKLSSLLGTSFPSIVRTQRRAYPWWVGGLLLLARSFAIHITSFDRLDLLSHGIRWFGNSGPCLSTVSFSGWLSWANFEHVTGWGSSLLILLVFSAGMAWNLIVICFLLVSGRVVCGIGSNLGCGLAGECLLWTVQFVGCLRNDAIWSLGCEECPRLSQYIFSGRK